MYKKNIKQEVKPAYADNDYGDIIITSGNQWCTMNEH